jgi:hypothetical protein
MHQGDDRQGLAAVLDHKNLRPSAWPHSMPATPKPVVTQERGGLSTHQRELRPSRSKGREIAWSLNSADAQPHKTFT